MKVVNRDFGTPFVSRHRPPRALDLKRDMDTWLAHLTLHNPGYTYGYDQGPVYFKVWRYRGLPDARSVVAFVRRKDGMVKRGDGWKKAGRFIAMLEQIVDDIHELGE